MLNLALAVLNLFPLPPLDGAGLVGGLVPPMRKLYDNFARLPYFGLASLLVVFYVLRPLWSKVDSWLGVGL